MGWLKTVTWKFGDPKARQHNRNPFWADAVAVWTEKHWNCLGAKSSQHVGHPSAGLWKQLTQKCKTCFDPSRRDENKPPIWVKNILKLGGFAKQLIDWKNRHGSSKTDLIQKQTGDHWKFDKEIRWDSKPFCSTTHQHIWMLGTAMNPTVFFIFCSGDRSKMFWGDYFKMFCAVSFLQNMLSWFIPFSIRPCSNIHVFMLFPDCYWFFSDQICIPPFVSSFYGYSLPGIYRLAFWWTVDTLSDHSIQTHRNKKRKKHTVICLCRNILQRIKIVSSELRCLWRPAFAAAKVWISIIGHSKSMSAGKIIQVLTAYMYLQWIRKIIDMLCTIYFNLAF